MHNRMYVHKKQAIPFQYFWLEDEEFNSSGNEDTEWLEEDYEDYDDEEFELEEVKENSIKTNEFDF